MKLSINKINHLAHLITKGLFEIDSIDFFATENDVRLRIKEIVMTELRVEDDIDRDVRKSITSMSRKLPEGSKEWEIVYNRLFNEEMTKRRGVT